MDPPAAPNPQRWPKRSKHFLRIGKSRFVPLLLFVRPSHFEKSTFDIILSILYDKLPQELVLDPKSGFQIVASPFDAQRPCQCSNDGIRFYYYWTPTPTTCSILTTKAKTDTEALTNGISSDILSPTNMTLIVCVRTCPNSKPESASSPTHSTASDPIWSQPWLDSKVTQYFSKEKSSSS